MLSSVSTLELLVIYVGVICSPHQSNLPIYADLGKFIVCSDQECMIYICNLNNLEESLYRVGVGVNESNEFLIPHGFDIWTIISCPWQFNTLDWINVARFINWVLGSGIGKCKWMESGLDWEENYKIAGRLFMSVLLMPIVSVSKHRIPNVI